MRAFVGLTLALNIAFSSLFGGMLNYFDMKDSKDNFFRLHIRANSDLEEDQELKLKVRDAVLEVTSVLAEGSKSKAEAIAAVKDGLSLIEDVATDVLRENGSAQAVSVEVKREYFEYREYGNFYLPAGYYDSLIIELGSGQGHNWWCVVFPAVCISGSAEAETVMAVNTSSIPEDLRLAQTPAPQKVKYEFWIVNAIKELLGLK